MSFLRLDSIVFLALAVAGIAGCGPSQPGGGAPGGGAGGPPPAEVNVTVVSSSPVDLTTELPGRLQAVRTAQVRARVDGVVEKILFKEGTDVKAGTPLFQIDPRAYRTAAEAARADAQAAEQVVQRYKALLDVKGVSQQDYDAAVTRAKQAQATLAKATIDQENTFASAPIAGRIGHALVTEGALVGHGDSTPLVNIDQMDPMYVNFTQSENEVFDLRQAIKQGQVKPGDAPKVELLLNDGTVYPLTGKLLVSEQTVDPNTGAVFLRAEFANPLRELMPGSFVRVRISQARMDQAITVPQRAVQMNSNGAFVLTVDGDNKVVPMPVQLGAMSGDKWVVSSGLREGMRVIVDGVQKAKPGATVKPVDADAAAQPAAGASAAAVPASAATPALPASGAAASQPVASAQGR